MKLNRIAILGAGNIGLAIGEGMLHSGTAEEGIILTRRGDFKKEERKRFICTTDNRDAVEHAEIIILAVQPGQADAVLSEIKDVLTDKHLLVSVVSGLGIARIEELAGRITIARAMPNTAIRVRESMTCLAFNESGKQHQADVEKIFGSVGLTLIIPESKFAEATVLCGSGTALAMKFLRAYMQACIQHGFNEYDALVIASQVLKGAAIIIQDGKKHPEWEIDRVTTPGGCTIVVLVEMEHGGFSSALLRGIEVGVGQSRRLYS